MALVLLTGSRRCSQGMAGKIKEVVNWIVNQGHCLIVGDAPGVDQVAIDEMLQLGQSHNVEICSAYSRTIKFPGKHVSTVLKKGNLCCNQYVVYMCNIVVAIWEGKSKGTEYTFKYALAQYKRVIVRRFKRSEIE